jgi:hypothetical protein
MRVVIPLILLAAGLACSGAPVETTPAPAPASPGEPAPAPASPGEPAPAPASPGEPALEPVKTFPPLEPSEARPLEIALAGTVGEFPRPAERYPTLMAVDGRPETAWVVRGTGHFELADAQIVAMELVPGFAKSESTWKNNRRPTKIRWRAILPHDEPGKRGSIEYGPWTEVSLSPPEALPSSPFVRVPLSDGSSAMRGIELEVLSATPKQRSDDICISEVRLLGRQEAPEPETRSQWRFTASAYMAGPDFDRLSAPFDQIDFEACKYLHDGTGGGGPSFEGKCRKEGGGWRLTGQQSESDGPTTPVDRIVPFTAVGRCLALIDGWPFSRC